MCSAMSNRAETLAKMGIEIYLDLLCIDANERLRSDNYKSISFLETGSVILCVTFPKETGYLLVNDFPVISLLRYPKFMKSYSRWDNCLNSCYQKRAKLLIYHLSASLSCQSNFPASTDHIFAVCSLTDFVLIASVQILSVITVSKPTIC